MFTYLKKSFKGHGPKHVYNTLGYIFTGTLQKKKADLLGQSKTSANAGDKPLFQGKKKIDS